MAIQMDLECSSITREMLPAVRAYTAEQLSRKYSMTQAEIAIRLGIAQVAVSKYLNGKYSEKVRRMKERVGKSRKVDGVVSRVAGMTNAIDVGSVINDLCTSLLYDDLVV